MEALNSHCTVTYSDGIAQLTICNAGPLNIVNSAGIQGIRDGLDRLAANESLRVLVLRGSGERSFIGGAASGRWRRSTRLGRTFFTGLRDLCEAVRQFPVPVIARLKGWCLGGGLEVAAACDLRIASQDAQFAMPEVKVGIPSVIHAALLPRLVGWGRARWLILTAATIDAATALNWGLVDRVANDGDLDAAIAATAAAIAACGPDAMRSQKALLRQWEELPLTESVNLSVGVFGRAFLTGEPQHHMRAFLDRKK